jgi:hypothetical protein
MPSFDCDIVVTVSRRQARRYRRAFAHFERRIGHGSGMLVAPCKALLSELSRSLKRTKTDAITSMEVVASRKVVLHVPTVSLKVVYKHNSSAQSHGQISYNYDHSGLQLHSSFPTLLPLLFRKLRKAHLLQVLNRNSIVLKLADARFKFISRPSWLLLLELRGPNALHHVVQPVSSSLRLACTMIAVMDAQNFKIFSVCPRIVFSHRLSDTLRELQSAVAHCADLDATHTAIALLSSSKRSDSVLRFLFFGVSVTFGR